MCNSAFLCDKNFIRDKNGNRPLVKDMDKVTINILHSCNVPLRLKQKAREYTKYHAPKRILYLIYTFKILARKRVSIELPDLVCLGTARGTPGTEVQPACTPPAAHLPGPRCPPGEKAMSRLDCRSLKSSSLICFLHI